MSQGPRVDDDFRIDTVFAGEADDDDTDKQPIAASERRVQLPTPQDDVLWPIRRRIPVGVSITYLETVTALKATVVVLGDLCIQAVVVQQPTSIPAPTSDSIPDVSRPRLPSPTVATEVVVAGVTTVWEDLIVTPLSVAVAVATQDAFDIGDYTVPVWMAVLSAVGIVFVVIAVIAVGAVLVALGDPGGDRP